MRRLEMIVSRLAWFVPTLAGLVVIVFLISNVIPTDPVRIMLGENATLAQVEAMRVKAAPFGSAAPLRPVLDQRTRHVVEEDAHPRKAREHGLGEPGIGLPRRSGNLDWLDCQSRHEPASIVVRSRSSQPLGPLHRVPGALPSAAARDKHAHRRVRRHREDRRRQVIESRAAQGRALDGELQRLPFYAHHRVGGIVASLLIPLRGRAIRAGRAGP